jgi:sulfur carrier protein
LPFVRTHERSHENQKSKRFLHAPFDSLRSLRVGRNDNFKNAGAIMKIKLNGNDHEIDSSKSVAELLSELKLPCGGIAVAVNGKIVARDARESHRINEGDVVEVIRAIGGG